MRPEPNVVLEVGCTLVITLGYTHLARCSMQNATDDPSAGGDSPIKPS